MERQYQVLFRSGVNKILPQSYVEGIDKAYDAYKKGGPNKRLKFSDGSMAFVCDLESIVAVEDHAAMKAESERVLRQFEDYAKNRGSKDSPQYLAWKETWRKVAKRSTSVATVEQAEAARLEYNRLMDTQHTFDEYMRLLPAKIRRDIELELGETNDHSNSQESSRDLRDYTATGVTAREIEQIEADLF